MSFVVRNAVHGVARGVARVGAVGAVRTVASVGGFSRQWASFGASKCVSKRTFMSCTPRLHAEGTKEAKDDHAGAADSEVAPIVDFAQMRELVREHKPNVVLVDVREPDEFAAGHIPGAINVPVKSAPGALGLHEEEFKLRFGFDKPDTDKTLVFYCLAGVRATMADELAYTFGYNHRLNYAGSFNDWVQQNGPIETPAPK